MLTDDQLAERIGPRLRSGLADIAAPDDLPDRLRRRQARQARRSVAAAAATAAVMAGAATLAVGASSPASPAPRATLTAWTVTTDHHGDVTVTIRAVYDPAGLQRKLQEAGIPAHVAAGRNPGPGAGHSKLSISDPTRSASDRRTRRRACRR